MATYTLRVYSQPPENPTEDVGGGLSFDCTDDSAAIRFALDSVCEAISLNDHIVLLEGKRLVFEHAMSA
jgi:hypothetical protein